MYILNQSKALSNGVYIQAPSSDLGSLQSWVFGSLNRIETLDSASNRYTKPV